MLCSTWVERPSSFKLYAIDSQVVSCKIVLYGYSPVPKSWTFICVITSNSVFAVPAPTDGAVKKPLGPFSFSARKYGTGSSENVTPSRWLTSKNDSSCRKMMFGVTSGVFVSVLSTSSAIAWIRRAE